MRVVLQLNFFKHVINNYSIRRMHNYMSDVFFLLIMELSKLFKYEACTIMSDDSYGKFILSSSIYAC